MKFEHNHQTYHIKRYPHTNNRSLKPWSAADEYILRYLDEEIKGEVSNPIIYNDRFGFLGCTLHLSQPTMVKAFYSQGKAWEQNFKQNKISSEKINIHSPLDKIASSTQIGIVHIPKSLELFKLYLYQLSQAIDESGMVVCAFMTRHFSPQLLTIASTFFEEVEQSKAWKKARLLILKKKKDLKDINLLNEIKLNEEQSFKQYYGVFSAKNIDYASQFLIEHIKVGEQENRILDLASGNGVLAACVRKQKPLADIHLLDDSSLAIASSQLNLPEENTHFHLADTLDQFDKDYFDYVVSNPPFHFEFETNIEVPLKLFKEVARCLKKDGRFQLVANQHLNYKTHLVKFFDKVEVTAENEKFIIYECFL